MRTDAELQAQFMNWVRELDQYLAGEARLETRAHHFKLEALQFGFLKDMTAPEFLKSGYNRSLEEIHPFELPGSVDRLVIETNYIPPKTQPPEAKPTVAVPEKLVAAPAVAPSPPVKCPNCGGESFEHGRMGHYAKWFPAGAWIFAWGSEITGRKCTRCGFLMLFAN